MTPDDIVNGTAIDTPNGRYYADREDDGTISLYRAREDEREHIDDEPDASIDAEGYLIDGGQVVGHLRDCTAQG